MNIYLGSENISTGGTVEFIKCPQCQFDSFRLELSADTDMVYQGVIGLVSRERREMLLTHLSEDEFRNFKDYSGNQLAARVNQIFQEREFTFYKSKHFTSKNGEPYWAAICPNCESSFLSERKLSLGEFIKEGGKIITYGLYE